MRYINAFVVANLTACFIMSLITIVSNPLWGVFEDFKLVFLAQYFILIFLATSSFVFPQSVIFGIPTLLIMRCLNIKGQLSVIIAAMLVAVVPWILAMFFPSLRDATFDVVFLIIIAIIGGVAGYVYERLTREKIPH